MTDVIIRKDRRAGRITLNRPKALNALTWDMCLAIEQAIDNWRDDPDVALVLIDAAGDRAFCSGGDIAEMYASGKRGDYSYGRRFWRDEYRLNAKLYTYPKPIMTFLHGFVMGGGVGVGCHGSHRIVCETTQVAMPECSIGLVPDVGGSLILAQAPGHLGEYLGVTGDRMDAGDAIYAGFADHYIPHAGWADLQDVLCQTGDLGALPNHPAPTSRLQGWQSDIDRSFGQSTRADIIQAIPTDPPAALAHAKKLMDRNAPLGIAVTIQLVRAVRQDPSIQNALEHEYRYTFRSMEHGDFIEGIRAAIIDKDRTPRWRHTHWSDVPDNDIARMLAPLGENALKL